MATIQDQIQSRIQSFVNELTQLVRAAAVESVQDALGGGATAVRRGPGRPRGSGSAPKAAASAPARRGKRGRRSSGDLETTTARFLGYIKAHDGQRLEEISRALEIPSSELKLPAQKLLQSKQVKTSGQKRGTRYHAAGMGSKTISPRQARKVTKRRRARTMKAQAAPQETAQAGV